MDKTSAPGNISGQHTDGDPETGTPATVVDALAMNGPMNELVELIRSAGGTPDPADFQQVREYLLAWHKENNLLFDSNISGNSLSWPTSLAAGADEIISDGWKAETTGLTVSSIADGNTNGTLIAGTGAIGDKIVLTPIYVKNYRQNKTSNIGQSPVPSDVFTAAVRFSSLLADAGAEFDVTIDHNTDNDTYFTVTDIASTTGSAGGTSGNIGSLASLRYSVLNSAANSNAVFKGPKITITLTTSGVFKIYLSGAGLWRSHLEDAYIPAVIMNDYLTDRAFSARLYGALAATIAGTSYSLITGYDGRGISFINGPGDVSGAPIQMRRTWFDIDPSELTYNAANTSINYTPSGALALAGIPEASRIQGMVLETRTTGNTIKSSPLYFDLQADGAGELELIFARGWWNTATILTDTARIWVDYDPATVD